MFIPPGATATSLPDLARARPRKAEEMAHALTVAALASPESDRQVCDILYPGLIEPLCDDFAAESATAADHVLAGIIRAVTGDDHRTAAALENSREESRLSSLAGQKPRRLLFLSRVSAGADVMITSVLISRLRQCFPMAEIHLAAPKNITAIFTAPHIHLHPLKINRHDGIRGRISFPPLDRLVRDLLGPDDIIVDPETRLTQLGLMPLVPGTRTLLFPARTFDQTDADASLAELANRWLDRSGCPGGHALPRIHISAAKREKTKKFCNRLRAEGRGMVILINLGVGGDNRKRLNLEQEITLIRGILERKRVTIILDSGRGMEEKSRVGTIITACGGEGKISVADLDLGEVAAHIAASDAFLGYDSSCQHIAAAVGTPSLTMFKGFAHQRFLKRWSPPTASSRVIPLAGDAGDGDIAGIITAAMGLRQ